MVLVVTGVLADARTPYALEADIGRWVFDLPDLLTTPLRAVMQVGGQLAILLVAAALVVAGRYRAAGAAALAGLGGWLACQPPQGRAGPAPPDPGHARPRPREIVDNASWPSSHATIAFALATVLLLTVARGRVGRGLVIAAAVLTAVGRVHLGVHWGLDVLGGAALGVLAGSLAVMIVKPT